MQMAASSSYKITIVLMVLVCLSNQADFTCDHSWKSDGNYYYFDSCLDQCMIQNTNNYNTTQQITAAATACCTTQCNYQVAYHTTKRTVIIVVASVLLFLLLLCCVFGCFGPKIKEKWVMKHQYSKRKPVSMGMSPQAFDNFAKQFIHIFTQDSRDSWVISFVVDGQKIIMQWFALDMKKKNNYQYKMRLNGQDIFGLWSIKGYFVNTQKGPVAWGLKNYQNAQNNSITFDNQSEIVHQIMRKQDGNYEGEWFNRKDTNKNGVCSLKRKQPGVDSEGIINPGQDPNFQIYSNPDSGSNI